MSKLTFADRLRRVIGERPIKPWAESLGIADATRSRMLNKKTGGVPPTYETLSRIMHVENASISWLIGGNDAPFLVYRASSDVRAADALQQLLEDEAGWRIHLLLSGRRAVWLLVQPAQLEHPKGTLDYWAIELIAHPLGPKVLEVVDVMRAGVIQGIHRVPIDIIEMIEEGEIGSWRLVGRPGRTTGMVDPERDDQVNLLHPTGQLRVAESSTTPVALQPLADWWPALSDAEREALSTIVDPLVDRARRRAEDGSN